MDTDRLTELCFSMKIEKWNVVKHVFCHNKHHLKNNYTGNYVMFLVYKSSLGIYLGISPVRIIIYLRSCDLAVKFEYFSFLFSFFKKNQTGDKTNQVFSQREKWLIIRLQKVANQD